MEQAQENADILASAIALSDRVLFSWSRSRMVFTRIMKLWQANVLACKKSKELLSNSKVYRSS